MTEYIQKAAAEVKNYSLDWSTKGLGTDTVSSATFSPLTNGLTVSNVTGGGTLSNCTIAGGAAVTYTITAAIVTAAGQTFNETLYCFVEP